MIINSISPDIDSIGDTVIYYCPVSNTYHGYIYNPILSLPFEIINMEDSISVDDSSLYAGAYIVYYLDTSNCTIFSQNLLLVETTQFFENDTLFSYCTFDSSYYYESPNGMETVIYRLDNDTAIYNMNDLIKGHYKLIHYDTSNCAVYTSSVEILEILPDTVCVTDTITYICKNEVYYLSPATGIMYDSSGSEVVESSPSNYLLNPNKGFYTFYSINIDSCILNKTVIEFDKNMLINDTAMLNDTIWYNCDAESDSVNFISDCDGIVIDKYWGIVDSISMNHYILNPQEEYYYLICRDTANCKVNKTILYFKDNINVPASTSNHLTGMYNRQEHPCCFIDLTEVECDGETALIFGQEIQVYNMNADFLYQTNLELYGGTVLGFRFCPPYWDTSSNVISNWYSIVIRNDECSFCRMDFMCDSVGDPEPFVILNYPSGKLKGGVSQTIEKAKTNGAVQASENKPTGGYLPMSVSVYPNPATSEVSVKVLSVNISNLTIQINDATGKPVYSGSYETTKGNLAIKVNLVDFASGVYTVYIPDLNYFYKLVIIK